MMSDQELLRYSRQILLPQIDVDGQLRLKQGRVLIVGLGGLGSPVSLYLAAAGIGELHLADFDTVNLTNLQRQIVHDSNSVGQSKVDSAMARLSALNPDVRLVPHTRALDEDSLAAAVAVLAVTALGQKHLFPNPAPRRRAGRDDARSSTAATSCSSARAAAASCSYARAAAASGETSGTSRTSGRHRHAARPSRHRWRRRYRRARPRRRR